jgi:choline monooxygenase
VVIDNYLDGGMHVPFAHKGLDSNLDFSSYATSVFDGYSIQSCEAAPQASERVGKAAVSPCRAVVYLFPSVCMVGD